MRGSQRRFYKITEEEFVNIDHIMSVRLTEDEVFLCFINGDDRSYRIEDLDTHFYNFIQIKLLL